MLAERKGQIRRSRQFEFEFEAIERERHRVAKELHDEVLPSLARLIRSIESQNENEKFRPLIDELHNVVSAFRDALGELHPVDLEELGLVAALHNICSRAARLSKRSISFEEANEECLLSTYQQLCVYRAVQTVLRMFAASSSDALVMRYELKENDSTIIFRVVDRTVSAHE